MLVDTHGVPIRDGDRVLIANDRGDIRRETVAEMIGGELMLRGGDGLLSTARNLTESIWWRNDTPSNWLTVLPPNA